MRGKLGGSRRDDKPIRVDGFVINSRFTEAAKANNP
jgi:hypothetical protein